MGRTVHKPKYTTVPVPKMWIHIRKYNITNEATSKVCLICMNQGMRCKGEPCLEQCHDVQVAGHILLEFTTLGILFGFLQ
jgi:hypothetical protein